MESTFYGYQTINGRRIFTGLFSFININTQDQSKSRNQQLYSISTSKPFLLSAQSTHKSTHRHNRKDFPPTHQRLAPHQCILQSPETNGSDEEDKDCHPNERGTERLTNDVEAHLQIWRDCVLDSEELGDDDACHDED